MVRDQVQDNSAGPPLIASLPSSPFLEISSRSSTPNEQPKLSCELESVLDRLKALERENELKEESQKLKREIDNLKEDKEELKRENDNSKEEVKELKRESDAWKAIYERLEGEQDALDERNERLERENDELKEETKDLTREVNELKEEVKGLKRQNNELKAEEEELRSIKDDLRSTYENLHNRLSKLDGRSVEDHDGASAAISEGRKRRKVDSSYFVASSAASPVSIPSSSSSTSSTPAPDSTQLATISATLTAVQESLTTVSSSLATVLASSVSTPLSSSSASSVRTATPSTSTTSTPAPDRPESAIVVKGSRMGNPSELYDISLRIQSSADEYVAKCRSNSVNFQNTEQCLASAAGKRSSVWWGGKKRGTVACRNCVKKGNPCVKKVDGRFVVLPLPAELMERNCKPGSDEYYVIWSADARKNLLAPL